MRLVSFLLALLFVSASTIADWPQNSHDSGRTHNVDFDTLTDSSGIWFQPFQRNVVQMATTAFPTQPLVSKSGSVIYFGPDNNHISSIDLNSGSPVILFTFDYTVALMGTGFQFALMPATIGLSHDQTSIFALYMSLNQTKFVLLSVDALSGQLQWWTQSNSLIVHDFVIHPPTPTQLNGWISLPQTNWVDFFVPPVTFPVNVLVPLNYVSRVASRRMLPMPGLYSLPLGYAGKVHFLFPYNNTHSQYTIADEHNADIASMFIPIGGDLVMVTPINSGVIHFNSGDNGDLTTIIYWNKVDNTLSSKSASGIRIMSYSFLASANGGIVLFAANDNGLASARYIVEQGFNTQVVWQVPLNLKYPPADDFVITVDVNNSPLDGLFYLQTRSKVAAFTMQGGILLWEMQGITNTQPLLTPVVASRMQGDMLFHFLLVTTTMADGITPAFTEIGCCNNHGTCQKTSQGICQCNINYYPPIGAMPCATFCNFSACQGDGANRGVCGAAGCMCNTDFYGINCQVMCTAASTCKGKGICNPKDGTCTCNSGNFLDFVWYSGPKCEIHQMNWLLIGCIGGGGLVIILIIVIGVVLCTKKKQNNNGYDALHN